MDKTSIFRCPGCRTVLEPFPTGLVCPGCKKEYLLNHGVLDFSDTDATEETRKTVSQFGESWKIFDQIEPYHEKQFLEWIYPLTREDFKDKTILEAGCGKGRHTVIVSSFEPRSMVAVDLSEAIFLTAKQLKRSEDRKIGRSEENEDPSTLPHFRPSALATPVTLVRSDLKNLPIPDNSFDLVFSVGVLHHVDKPGEALSELWRILKPGGKLLLWVYAREGNGWILYLVNPLRKMVTSKIPTKFLRVLSLPLTYFLYLILKLFYGPLTRRGEKRSFLPYSSYLGSISLFPFKEIDNIVVDHLCPPVAFYLSRPEIEEMFKSLAPRTLEFRWHHKNSWTVLAYKGEDERKSGCAEGAGKTRRNL
jgi:SAM-dependent methyltransferase